MRLLAARAPGPAQRPLTDPNRTPTPDSDDGSESDSEIGLLQYGTVDTSKTTRDHQTPATRTCAYADDHDPEVRRAVSDFLIDTANAKTHRLTGRQLQILALIATGQDTPTIANTLHLTPHTVHTHRRRLYRKLHAHTAAHAITRAFTLGILTPNPNGAKP